MNTEADIKEELLESIKETKEECKVKPDEVLDQVTRLEDAISVIKRYQELIIIQKQKIIGLLHGNAAWFAVCLLRKFKSLKVF